MEQDQSFFKILHYGITVIYFILDTNHTESIYVLTYCSIKDTYSRYSSCF
jgi:hypothetical protein